MSNAEDIRTNSQDPKRASVDGDSAEQHSLPDQISSDRYAEGQVAKSNGRPGIRFFQIRNRGTV